LQINIKSPNENFIRDFKKKVPDLETPLLIACSDGRTYSIDALEQCVSNSQFCSIQNLHDQQDQQQLTRSPARLKQRQRPRSMAKCYANPVLQHAQCCIGCDPCARKLPRTWWSLRLAPHGLLVK